MKGCEPYHEPVDMYVVFSQATSRAHPQSVTGAFMSGLREAYRIASSSYDECIAVQDV